MIYYFLANYVIKVVYCAIFLVVYRAEYEARLKEDIRKFKQKQLEPAFK